MFELYFGEIVVIKSPDEYELISARKIAMIFVSIWFIVTQKHYHASIIYIHQDAIMLLAKHFKGINTVSERCSRSIIHYVQLLPVNINHHYLCKDYF